jgi:hypothetical protein
MPVFTRMREGVLVLTVDGDYTVNELRRVAFGAFEASTGEVPAVLDLSGAAGLAKKSAADLAATGAIFGAYRDRLTAIATVTPADVAILFDAESDFAREAGVRVRACVSHADARAWLAAIASGSADGP